MKRFQHRGAPVHQSLNASECTRGRKPLQAFIIVRNGGPNKRSLTAIVNLVPGQSEMPLKIARSGTMDWERLDNPLLAAFDHALGYLNLSGGSEDAAFLRSLNTHLDQSRPPLARVGRTAPTRRTASLA